MEKEKLPISLVWFKRDLRVFDHAPLQKAIETGGEVACFFAFEPSVLKNYDSDERHWRFVFESLEDLRKRWPRLQIALFYGEIEPILLEISKKRRIENLFSHEEVGAEITFSRDRGLKKFCIAQKIRWHETPVGAIQRGSKNRKNWSDEWRRRMTAPIIFPDLENLKTVRLEPPPALDLPAAFLQKMTARDPLFQLGGEGEAISVLKNFLEKRYVGYSAGISKPELAQTTCSRLSPFLAWGNLSVRQVVQAVEKSRRKGPMRERPLSNFVSRMHWHDHFVQKLESEPRYEFENINRAFDALDKPLRPDLIEKWAHGETGLPLVDASMRSVRATGWLNFRMRAMLVSTLSHAFWQPWQTGAGHLARQFLDYDPGIHFPQFQMQAGTTGVNTIRVYNPILNAQKHDADAVFLRKWLPELAHLPTPFVHEPWKMTALEQGFYRFELGKNYPAPCVDLSKSLKSAGEKMWSWLERPETQAENARILARHTFRKSARDQKPISNFHDSLFDEKDASGDGDAD